MSELIGGRMYIILVHIHIKAESMEEFKLATLDNAKNSVQETGVERFDVLQQSEDPTRFTLVEVYRSSDDHAKHRETAHYERWRDRVTDMMVDPRVGIKYSNVFPEDKDW
jgi:(4S)-4-hydroxy-5-phosphonooxypentane-2,3-dione isomerase